MSFVYRCLKLKLKSMYMIMILWLLFTSKPNYMVWVYFPSRFIFLNFWLTFFLYCDCLCSIMILLNQRYLFILTTLIYWYLSFGANYLFFYFPLIWADYSLGSLKRCHLESSSLVTLLGWSPSFLIAYVYFFGLPFKLLEYVLR